MDALSETLLDFARHEGACAVGIATVETLAEGPPSADITYVMPEAKSAVAFAVPLNQDLILPYLTKRDRLSVERDIIRANSRASGISLELANYLQMRGIEATPVLANLRYRADTPNGIWDMYPDISHRYLAIRSGVGYIGLSGNVITPTEGAPIILGSMVTSAELTPTGPLPPDHNYCDSCGLCMASCASAFVDLREKVSVALGGIEFVYSKRRDFNRCGYVCGGFTGLHPSGKWSTWSPGRFPIPTEEGQLSSAMAKAMKRYRQWPPIEGGLYNPLMKGKVRVACAHCQLVCAPDREERQRRHRALTESGVVIQESDGSLVSVSPEIAVERLASMRESRLLYEEL
jgi:epoxyqueuosine reductase